MTDQIRLNKFLAERLGLSRREADDAIAAGRVKLGNRVAKLGDRIDVDAGRVTSSKGVPHESRVGEETTAGPAQEIYFDGKLVPFETDYLYIAMNKPMGYVCSRRAQGPAPTIYEILPKKYQALKTVGRLDKDSSGLILLTNDGDFAFEHTHPKFAKRKIYEVELDRPLESLHQQMISDYGVLLDDGPSKFDVISTGDGAGGTPAERSDVGETATAGPVERMAFTVVLHEGRNRQIRRTFAALGYKVTKLHRTNFGKYGLGDLEPGQTEEFKP